MLHRLTLSIHCKTCNVRSRIDLPHSSEHACTTADVEKLIEALLKHQHDSEKA